MKGISPEMNKNMKRMWIYLPILLLTIAVTVTLRTVALIRDLDPEVGYFSNKTIITVASIFLVSACVILFSYIFIGHKASLKASFSTPATYVPTGLVAAALIFLSGSLMRFARSEFVSGNKGAAGTLAIVGAVLAIGSIVHFFLNTFLTERKNEMRGYFALATIIFLAVYSCYLYFRTDTPINNPGKLTDQMAFLFAAIFFLYEARISLGREKWRAYCAFGMVSAALLAYSSIPAIITYFATGATPSTGIEENILSLALFIFILARLFLTVGLPEAKKNELIEAMDGYANKRAMYVSEDFRRRKGMFNTQMTMDIDMLMTSEEDETAEEEPLSEFDEVTVEDGGTDAEANEPCEVKEDLATRDPMVDAIVSEAEALFAEAESIMKSKEEASEKEDQNEEDISN